MEKPGVGLAARFIGLNLADVWVIDSPFVFPLPELGDSIVLGGKEYTILWRRWRLDLLAQTPKAYVDIGVQDA